MWGGDQKGPPGSNRTGDYPKWCVIVPPNIFSLHFLIIQAFFLISILWITFSHQTHLLSHREKKVSKTPDTNQFYLPSYSLCHKIIQFKAGYCVHVHKVLNWSRAHYLNSSQCRTFWQILNSISSIFLSILSSNLRFVCPSANCTNFVK